MKTTVRNMTARSLCVLLPVALVVCVRAQPPVPLLPETPGISVIQAQLPGKAVQDKVLLLLKTIEADKYGEFAAAITDDFKAAMPPKEFQAMREPLAPRLQNGYDLSYLGEVRKGDYTTYVWKIVFREQRFDPKTVNETMMTITLRDVAEGEQDAEKVSGIFLD